MNYYKRNKYARRKKNEDDFASGKYLENFISTQLMELNNYPQYMLISLQTDKKKGKRPSDFILQTYKNDFLFDCKECGETKFYLSKVSDNQKESLLKYNEMSKNKIGAFIIMFTNVKEELKITGENKRFIIHENRDIKYYTIDDGLKYDISIFR